MKEYRQLAEALPGHLGDNWGTNALKMPCTNRNGPVSSGSQVPMGCSVTESWRDVAWGTGVV